MPTTWHQGLLTLSVEQEVIPIHTFGDRPDENWKVTDEGGHDHYYDRAADSLGYPTLFRKVMQSEECDGVHFSEHCRTGIDWVVIGDDEYESFDEVETHEIHEPHVVVIKWQWQCRLCPRIQKPGRTSGPLYHRGLIYASVTGKFVEDSVVHEITIDLRGEDEIKEASDYAAHATVEEQAVWLKMLRPRWTAAQYRSM